MSLTNIETEAFVVTEPKAPFKLTPISLDEVRGNEILVEMKYSGICHTVSPPPFQLGGESLLFDLFTDLAQHRISLSNRDCCSISQNTQWS